MSTTTDCDRDDPVCSIVAVGRGKYFWVLWRSVAEVNDGKNPVASGTAESTFRAHLGVVDYLGSLDQPYRRAPGRWAREWRKVLSARKRACHRTEGDEAAVREYVYEHYPSSFDRTWHTIRHRIIRKTASRLYVAKDAIGQHGHDGYEFGGATLVDTIILDRRRLEAGEWLFHRGSRRVFTLAPEPPDRCSGERPPSLDGALSVLGLTWPCDAEAVRSAFRRLSKGRHPDVGGDQQAFIDLKAAYDRLLAYVERMAG